MTLYRADFNGGLQPTPSTQIHQATDDLLGEKPGWRLSIEHVWTVRGPGFRPRVRSTKVLDCNVGDTVFGDNEERYQAAVAQGKAMLAVA